MEEDEEEEGQIRNRFVDRDEMPVRPARRQEEETEEEPGTWEIKSCVFIMFKNVFCLPALPATGSGGNVSGYNLDKILEPSPEASYRVRLYLSFSLFGSWERSRRKCQIALREPRISRPSKSSSSPSSFAISPLPPSKMAAARFPAKEKLKPRFHFRIFPPSGVPDALPDLREDLPAGELREARKNMPKGFREQREVIF